jgi:hypothetical protein
MGGRKLTLIVQGAVICASVACGPAAHAAGTFDGDWNATLTCPKAPDGAWGYTYQFPVEIQENVLHGEHGVRDAAGWLTLDGKIEPDGSATLVAQGLTNAPPYAVGHVDKKTPYTYEVAAQFDAASGSGSRTTARKCDIVFVKE